MNASNPPAGEQVRAERKLVTVVVYEVGEPAVASGHGDLEDSDRLLAGTLTTVQAEVARHSGLVAEVIGDVVVAVFGVPRTRDDDAERAVLAAMAARDRLATSSLGNLRVRAAVASGEALVSPGEPAGAGGWGISGEVVAAAMAVKDAAPPGALLVTAATLQATPTRGQLRAGAAAAHGWCHRPGAGVGRVGASASKRPRAAAVLGAELVGRDGELAVLLDRYQRIRTGGGPQLVTLVGSAGIGKTRLLAELGRRVGGTSAPPAVWRTGRAQPNVDGGTFGALVEVAKAEAGILDGDPATVAEHKLSDAIARVLEGPTAAWVTPHPRLRLGAGQTPSLKSDKVFWVPTAALSTSVDTATGTGGRPGYLIAKSYMPTPGWEREPSSCQQTGTPRACWMRTRANSSSVRLAGRQMSSACSMLIPPVRDSRKISAGIALMTGAHRLQRSRCRASSGDPG